MNANKYKQRRAYSQAYQLRLTQARAKGDHTYEQWCQLKEVSGHICVKCGKPEHSIRGGLTRGKIIPICLGGDNSIQNIQPLCQSCASAKGPDTTNYLQLRAAGLWPKADREPPVPAPKLLRRDVGTPGSRLTKQTRLPLVKPGSQPPVKAGKNPVTKPVQSRGASIKTSQRASWSLV